jgi:hypothetical protein
VSTPAESRPRRRGASTKSPNVLLTAEAFAELLSAAQEELHDNSESHQILDLRCWMQKFRGTVNAVARYRDDLDCSSAGGETDE